ncbi:MULTISPECIES: PPOX class F420-dependent oxidoreductase [unclassified Streptomyces]|uniref:PPOX class F420-dependent oxidoreductase n=1 Tax=unclassified Streptomyces TaxID=2593676 RepID=UPI00380AD23C
MIGLRARKGRLADAKRVLLTSFRSDGSAVTEASWVVPDGHALGLVVPTGSALAARLRARPGVLVASGPGEAPIRARAGFLGAEGSVRYRTALVDKYGLSAVVLLARSRMRHGLAGTVGVRLVAGGTDGGFFGTPWQPSWAYSPN